MQHVRRHAYLNLWRAVALPNVCRVQSDLGLHQEGHQQLQVALPQVHACTHIQSARGGWKLNQGQADDA